jgi:SWI/SNF-related matrix-associated actin-dependent regulator 1 of chromatin subfamily A
MAKLVMGYRMFPAGEVRGARGAFFVCTRSRSDSPPIKEAGFWFHGRAGECRMKPCGACVAGVPTLGAPGLPYGEAYWWCPNDAQGRTKASRLASIADEEATRALTDHAASVEASRAQEAVGAAAEVDVVASPHRAPYGYQRAGAALALRRKAAGGRGYLIGDQMGLGKTLQALMVINSDPSIVNTLVVCPASLRLNWALEAFVGLARPTHVHVVDAATKVPRTVAARAGAHTVTMGPVPPPEARLVIANFERARSTETLAALTARAWDLLVVDEAHRLKNERAQQTKAVLGGGRRARDAAGSAPDSLASKARFLLLLTGTPIPNKVVELWPLVNAVAPEAFPAFFPFARRYCGATQGRFGWDFSGATNLSELQEVLRATCMVRRLKDDVLTELPPKTRQLVVLPTNGAAAAVNAELAAYEAANGDRALAQADADLAHAAGDADAYAKAVARLAKSAAVDFSSMSATRLAVALQKVPYVVEHLERLIEDGMGKLIVFAWHGEVIRQIAAAFGDAAVTLTGETPMAARQAAVDRFQTDPSCRVFVGNIQAAGVGITLTASHYVGFAELDWVPANVTQAEDRPHRLGQRDNVLVQHFVFDGSLDQRMAETIIAKQAVADGALDVVHDRAIAAPDAHPVEEGPRRAIAAAPPAAGYGPRADAAEPVSVDQITPGKHLRVERPDRYPAATDDARAAAHAAMRALAGVCDGAQARDDAGFSKVDAYVGRKLAELDRPLTDGEVWFARVLARRYRRQLSAALLAALDVAPDATNGADDAAVVPAKTAAEPVPCPTCGRAFAGRRGLARHARKCGAPAVAATPASTSAEPIDGN